MKKFRFSLRPVAVLRAHRELRAREALAAAIHDCAEAKRRLDEAGERAAGFAAIISSGRLSGAVRAGDAAAFQQGYRRECGLQAEAAKQHEAASEAVAKRREAYLAASRDCKAVAKLEERARLAHWRELLRAEQAELDGIAVSRASRAGAAR